MKRIALVVGFVLALSGVARAAEAHNHAPSVEEITRKPNLLWITAEDICPNLGCYGDPDAVTPNLDRFAAQAVRFTNTFSVHPCCSPSRSCLATGVYPTRLGTFQHRGKVTVSADLVKCFPTYLREAGYYCFNGAKGGGSKLDYNFDPQDQSWDKVKSNQVEWRNRKPGQPFFGQINLGCTHQSQYGQREPGSPPSAAKQASGRRGKGEAAPADQGSPPGRAHDPAKVHVPPYHPDTPAAREIWAEYHDRITQMDGQFADMLAQLEDDGLADDTVVFFFGDNGHGIPGGKVWLWDQGPHVPLMIRFPKAWQHLMAAQPGTLSDRLVSFLDFAPTMLSLAGVPIPSHMQGVAFAGQQAGSPHQYVFAARDFHDGADFDTARMVRDGRYHYIRNFMPHLGWDAIQYSWKKAPFHLDAWREEAAAGRLQADTRQACFFRRNKPSEELYDMQADRFQMRNLAGDPKHANVLRRMRAQCQEWMIENRDLGLLSQFELYARSEKDSPLAMGMDVRRNPIRRLLDAADRANARDPLSVPRLVALLTDEDCAVRRWGAIGLLALGARAAPAGDAVRAALRDSSPDVRMTATEALFQLGQGEAATPVLIELLRHPSPVIRNETLLALCRIGPPARAVLPHLDGVAASGKEWRVWSYDNVPDAVELARACLNPQSNAKLHATRQKYLP